MSLLDSIRKIFASREGEDRSVLSKRVQATPQDPQARQKLGIFLLRQGEIVEGLDQLARAAVMYEKDGFAGKAIAVLRQMLKNDTANLDFQKWLIRLLAQEGLLGDARREVENAVLRQGMFTGDDQKIEFLRQVGETLKGSPVTAIHIADALRSQRKLYEAAAELDKAAGLAVPSRMTAEFSERIAGLAQAAGDDEELLESCGFLWLRIGKTGDGLQVLIRVRDRVRDKGETERAATMDRVIAAVHGGWDPAKADARSFEDAARKLEQGEAPPEAPPSASPPAARKGPEPVVFREDESIVQDALSRLQSKVKEEIGDSDLDARYNLGIAYKEMGLLEEAINEFSLARGKPELFAGATSLLADTLAEKGDFTSAVGTIGELLSSNVLGEKEVRDVRYQKAVLLSRAGREEEALEIFLSIHEEAPDYRDVAQRTEKFRR
jgi:tetratricopeptide (TPR) repeat protein